MCGIVGIVSRGDPSGQGAPENVVPELLRGLCRLEYRGYDSCGVATRNGRGIEVTKDVGGPSRLLGPTTRRRRWWRRGAIRGVAAYAALPARRVEAQRD